MPKDQENSRDAVPDTVCHGSILHSFTAECSLTSYTGNTKVREKLFFVAVVCCKGSNGIFGEMHERVYLNARNGHFKVEMRLARYLYHG